MRGIKGSEDRDKKMGKWMTKSEGVKIWNKSQMDSMS